MKNLILLLILLLFPIALFAQEEEEIEIDEGDYYLGITAGYMQNTISTDGANGNTKTSNSGVYIGILMDFKMNEILDIQPELIYLVSATEEAIALPILAKIRLKFPLYYQVGPQLVFGVTAPEEGISGFDLGLANGLRYDFSKKVFLETRYIFQLNNSYSGFENLRVKTNYFHLGLAYKFQ